MRTALTRPDIGHRDEDFIQLQRDIRGRLLRLFDLRQEYQAVLLVGSATLAIESLLTAAGTLGPVLVLANGHYGERAAELLRTYNLSVRLLRQAWGAPLDLSDLAVALTDPAIRSVYVVHHETTTGLLNPLLEIADIVRSTGRYLLVDGVSSIAGETLDIAGWGISGIAGSANKCLRSVPGLAFVLVRDDFLAAVRLRARRISYYSDLLAHLDAEEQGTFPFTPAVHAAFALQEALAELEEEGLPARVEHYRRVARRLRAGLATLGLSLFLPTEQLANTMTPVRFPPGLTYAALHGPLKARGFLIYEAMGAFRTEMFRLGTVGYFGEADIDRFLAALREVLPTLVAGPSPAG